MTSATENQGKIDLTTFFLSIASAAYLGLGLGPREAGASEEKNLELAKQNIDLLELMHSKTRGNRSAEEDRLIDQLLFELRLRFVETSKK